MVDEMMTFRIVARSTAKAGDLIVEDADGNRRLFLGSTGAMSQGALNPDFIELLLQRQRWEPVDDDATYTLASLRREFSEVVPTARLGLTRRVATALAGRRAA